jgi:hypothetical protein
VAELVEDHLGEAVVGIEASDVADREGAASSVDAYVSDVRSTRSPIRRAAPSQTCASGST